MKNYDDDKAKLLKSINDKLSSIQEMSKKSFANQEKTKVTIRKLIQSNKDQFELYNLALKSESFDPIQRIDMALEICSTNFELINNKFNMNQLFIEDLFKQMGILSESVTKLTKYLDSEQNIER